LQEDAFSIVQTQKRAGVVNELAVAQFEAQLLNSRPLEKEILQNRIETENKINYLLGRICRILTATRQPCLLPIPFKVGLGIPFDLLRNRPDIRQAEFNRAASREDLKAAFYPSLNIRGAYGLQAFNTSFLFTTPQSIAYSILEGSPLRLSTARPSSLRFSIPMPTSGKPYTVTSKASSMAMWRYTMKCPGSGT
jgi:multidrug efflux system outer membrane protein